MKFYIILSKRNNRNKDPNFLFNENIKHIVCFSEISIDCLSLVQQGTWKSQD